MNDLKIYLGKRVLLTGHTGFKGTWLSQILIEAGADVYGISLKPEKDCLYSLIPKLQLKKSVYLNINNAILFVYVYTDLITNKLLEY